jgi:lysophospholipid acyltransferase (LPLAT)-like uncharacterized protein
LKDAEEAKHHRTRSLSLAFLWTLSAWPLALLLRLYTGLADFSSRVRVEGQGARYRGAALYVNWHRYLPYLSVHHGKARRWLMVSKDAYMAPIVRWEQLHGVRTLRGGSGDGGQEAAAHMVERLKSGDSAFLAVDGPRGPALHVKRGCVEMARAAGVPIIPVGYRTTRGRFHPRRWDHWLMPRPFDTIAVVYGRPLRFDAEEALTEALKRVAEGLKQVSDSREQPGETSGGR